MMVSRTLCCLVTSCFIAVKNPAGFLNPVNQKHGGRPSFNHFRSWTSRSRSDANHNPRVDEIQENSSDPGVQAQTWGTRASYLRKKETKKKRKHVLARANNTHCTCKSTYHTAHHTPHTTQYTARSTQYTVHSTSKHTGQASLLSSPLLFSST